MFLEGSLFSRGSIQHCLVEAGTRKVQQVCLESCIFTVTYPAGDDQYIQHLPDPFYKPHLQFNNSKGQATKEAIKKNQNKNI